MLLSKKMISLLLVLASVSLMGTGFSAWLINTGDSYTSVNGGIDVSDLFDVSEYIYFDTTNDSDGVKPFSYSEFSFLDSSGNETNEASIILNLKINIEKCASYFKKCSSLSVTSLLAINQESEIDLFNTSYLPNTEVLSYNGVDKDGYTMGGNIKGTDRKPYGKGIDTSFTLSNILLTCNSIISATITYKFNIESSDFENYIYPYLSSDKITFKVGFMLRGV